MISAGGGLTLPEGHIAPSVIPQSPSMSHISVLKPANLTIFYHTEDRISNPTHLIKLSEFLQKFATLASYYNISKS